MLPEKAEGHLDHLIRQTRMHHMQLSAMADVKANILLTMSSVVLTLSVTNIADPVLKWPTLILISFCLLTIALATYAVMPKLPVHKHPPDLAEAKGPLFNPLFFGDFAGMSLQDFEETMGHYMATPQRAYEVQIREVFVLGQFLAKKKYRFIRMAYISFITGILASGIGIITSSAFA